MQGEANFNYNMFRLNLWTRHFLHPSVGAGGLETSPYLAASPLASPAALMVLQGAAGERAREVGHLAPGHPGGADKEAGALYRPGEPFPAHMYGQVHQSFLRPHVDPALALLGGHRQALYRFPLPDEHEAYASAFVPAKRARTEAHPARGPAERELSSPARGTPGEERAVPSPASLHRESPISDTHSDSTDRRTPDNAKQGECGDRTRYTSAADRRDVCNNCTTETRRLILNGRL